MSERQQHTEQSRLYQAFNQRISRREFLRDVGITTAVAIDLVACTPPSPTKPVFPSLERVSHLPELTEEEVTGLVRSTGEHYKEVFGVALDVDRLMANFVFVPILSRLPQTQRDMLCAQMPCEDVGYVSAPSHGRKLYINNNALDIYFKNAPNTTKAKQDRTQIVEEIIAHEVTHWNAIQYQNNSGEIRNLALSKIIRRYPQFAGITSAGEKMLGASITLTTDIPDTPEATIFRAVEEAEAEISGQMYMKSKYPTGYETGQNTKFLAQQNIYNDLLTKLGIPYEEAVKTLARMRTEDQGREKWMRFIGERLGRTTDALEHGFEVLFAIDTTNETAYQKLVAASD